MDSTLSNTDCRKDDFMKNRKPAIALILLIDVLVIIGLMVLGLIIGFKWIDKKLEEEIRNEVVSYKFEAESKTETGEVIEEEKELGIMTLDDLEIERMIGEWNNRRNGLKNSAQKILTIGIVNTCRSMKTSISVKSKWK